MVHCTLLRYSPFSIISILSPTLAVAPTVVSSETKRDCERSIRDTELVCNASGVDPSEKRKGNRGNWSSGGLSTQQPTPPGVHQSPGRFTFTFTSRHPASATIDSSISPPNIIVSVARCIVVVLFFYKTFKFLHFFSETFSTYLFFVCVPPCVCISMFNFSVESDT